MRNIRYKTTLIVIFLAFNFSPVMGADLIYGFKKVVVTKALTTSVEFDQDDLNNIKNAGDFKLRVFEDDKVIREDTIIKKDGVWIWNKILPFSEHLKFVILKNAQPVSIEYSADTRSSLVFSENNFLPMIRGVHYLPSIPESVGNEKRSIPIEIPEVLKNCKDNVLIIVFNKASNALLWQYYGKIKNDLMTNKISYSEDIQPSIITDEGSCVVSP